MRKEILYRYVSCQSTPEEEQAVLDWLDADPSHHQELLDIRVQHDAVALSAPLINALYEEDHSRRHRVLHLVQRWGMRAAAAVLLCVGTWHAADHHLREEVADTMLSFQTQNAPVQYTLSDGTQVWLNAGTRIEYPAAFTGRERRVHIEGEALFAVKHDAQHPFIVETFACQVEVLGTRFNIEADSDGGTFSTALLEGSIQLTNKSSGERVTLIPDDYASLKDGKFTLSRIRSHDDYLWPEGILSIGGCMFEDVMLRLEKIYGVKIVIEGPSPVLNVARGKIWTSMGLDYVLKTLQDVATFRYDHDEQTNTVYIR